MSESQIEGNPQGKGLVPALDMLRSTVPQAVSAKPADVIVSHYLISALVLSSKFKFKPIADKPYFLYRQETDWVLSLIGPTEWKPDVSGVFVGQCQLRRDMTWDILPSDQLQQHPHVVQALGEFRDNFTESLDGDAPLEDRLPFYNSALPFYQRVFASALSHSLRSSLQAAGLMAISGRNWLDQVPRLGHVESSD